MSHEYAYREVHRHGRDAHMHMAESCNPRHGHDPHAMHRHHDHGPEEAREFRHHGRRHGFGGHGWGGMRPPFAHGWGGMRPPFMHGHHGHDDRGFQRAPWSGMHERRQAMRALFPQVKALLGELRDVEPGRADRIVSVLEEARKRIAAIKAEGRGVPTTML